MSRALAPVLLIAGLALAWVALGHIPVGELGGPKCAVLELTGLHCPGCGGTRAAQNLVRGNWLVAARSNVLIYPVAVGVLWGVLALGAKQWFGTQWWHPLAVSRKGMMVLLILITIFTLVRNLEWASFLRP